MVLRIVPTVAFPTVQDAIDVSSPGDSIKILAGKFDGFEVTVQGLKIFGCGIGRTIIEGVPAGGGMNGVLVIANLNMLQGFTIQGFIGNGISVVNNGCILKDIESINNQGAGFLIINPDNYLTRCIAAFNTTGYNITTSSLVFDCQSFLNKMNGFETIGNDISIINSTSEKNGENGVLVGETNTIFENKIQNNRTDGVELTDENSNIQRNTICHNGSNGISVLTGVSGNSIDSNIVRNNGTDITNAGILVEDGAMDNDIRFNKAKDNVEFDIEAQGAAFADNTFDANQCGSSDPATICT
ncbi:right-handed parallel beta-helix repeat-containing protein [Bacillus spongiae]|uniref:Right-handed parallel beta-helix repeat-containing protein n=1 Tax=Bacillus spongiae TaxID=2683610 RepID=A0ABU8HE56_9BACI